MNESARAGAVAGGGAFEGRGSGEGAGKRREQGAAGNGDLLDHEKLEVYCVARDFLVLATKLQARKMPRELRDPFDRASLSILFNIGEGAAKTARADKQRSYEIARGSTTEAATQLDALLIREAIARDEYEQARALLVRIAKMLSRLCGPPRST